MRENRGDHAERALRRVIRLVAGIALLIVGVGTGNVGAQPLTEPSTALQDYVARPDDTYRWWVVQTDRSGDGYTAHLLRLVSQKWRSKADLDAPIWRHWLVVMVPDQIKHQTAALVIAGGSRGGARPSFDDDELSFAARLAVISKTPVAVLMQAPLQPIAFPDEPWPHKEDELVAYSWDKALETGDFSWPVYLPMVKAAVRAMDTIQNFVPTVSNETIADFVVIGGSKRGAATWLTAAVDARVKAIAPMVIDIVHFDRQMAHHLAVYGDYAPALQNYVDYDLVQQVESVDGVRLRAVIDPWKYRRVLRMPKYILNSTGDQFFPPDSSKFYFSRLRGESLLRYVPNSDHSLAHSDGALIDAVAGLFAWYLGIVEGLPRPEITWQQTADGRVVVTTSPPPLAARLWQAKNPDARDFRLDTIGEAWTKTKLSKTRRGRYEVVPKPPAAGWKAFFVELVYPSAQPGLCQVYSTRVFVTPDIRPFEGLTPGQLPPGGALSGLGAGAGSAGLRAPRGVLGDALDFVDGFAGSISTELHEIALAQLIGDGIEGRAVTLCAAQSLAEFDELLELYVRLGTGQSFEGFTEDQLAKLQDDATAFGSEVWTGATGLVDDLLDRAGDTIDDVIDDIDDFF